MSRRIREPYVQYVYHLRDRNSIDVRKPHEIDFKWINSYIKKVESWISKGLHVSDNGMYNYGIYTKMFEEHFPEELI